MAGQGRGGLIYRNYDVEGCRHWAGRCYTQRLKKGGEIWGCRGGRKRGGGGSEKGTSLLVSKAGHVGWLWATPDRHRKKGRE